MIRRPPRSTRTDTLFPYTTLFRSLAVAGKTVADLYLADAGIQPALVNPPFNPHDLPRDVPIHGTAMGGSLEVRSNGELSQIEETLVEDGVVGYARRTPSIDSNRKSYALYITGESMEPRYRAGVLVYVDPRRAPYIGDDVRSEVRRVGNVCVSTCRTRL